MMLVEMHQEEYRNLTGVDYSENAIRLAAEIAKDKDMDIKYEVLDMLSATDIDRLFGSTKFNVIHDKGTYDAISLHPENPQEKRDKYIANVHKLAADDGLFILSSCNWTESELCTAFMGSFEMYKLIPTPTFRFGGTVGTVYTQVVFKKILSNE